MGARALASLSWVVPGNSRLYLYPNGSSIPPGCNRIIAREPVVVPPATLERPTGYLLPPLRIGLAIRKQWEDLTPACAGTR